MDEMRLLERVLFGSSIMEKVECARELLKKLGRDEVSANSIELMHNKLEDGDCELGDEIWQGQPQAVKELLQDIGVEVEARFMNSMKNQRPRNHSGSFRIPAPSPDSGSWGRETLRRRLEAERRDADRRARDSACGLYPIRRRND